MLKSDKRYGEIIGHIKDKKLVKYANNTKQLLSVTIQTKQGDRVDTVVFGTKNDPQKPVEVNNEIKVGDYVSANGGLTERQYTSQANGQVYTSYSLSVNYYRHLNEETNQSGTSFELSGVIQKRKGSTITVLSQDRYTKADGEDVVRDNTLTIKFDEDLTQCDDFDDLVPNTKVTIVGAILNRFESTALPTEGPRIDAMGDAGKKRAKGKPRVELLAAIIRNMGEAEDDSLDELDGEDIPF